MGPVVYTFGGMVLGNVINPYFPNNLRLFWEHVYTKFKVGSDFAVAVGGEWYPYSGMELLTHFPGRDDRDADRLHPLCPEERQTAGKSDVLSDVRFHPLRRPVPVKTFCRIFPAVRGTVRGIQLAGVHYSVRAELPDEFKREIEPYLDVDKKTEKQEWWRAGKTAAVWVLGIVLVFYFYVNTVGLGWMGIDQPGLMNTLKDNEANDKYRRSMEWATGVDANGKENIPAGTRIFNCNWDDFPKLFFFNTKHRYVYGLDPNYLYSQNPDLYKLLIEITDGKTDDAGPIIRERFGAEYIFADAKENEQMIAKACSKAGGSR